MSNRPESSHSSDDSVPSDPGSPEIAEAGTVLLCPGCLSETAADADFCAQCGMPVGHISTIDPIQRIRAEGWLYRRALRARPRTIVLAGMWLIFVPLVLGAGLFLRDLPWPWGWYRRVAPWPLSVATLVICIGSTVLYGTILYRMTQHYLNWRPTFCPACGEEIEQGHAACSECGAAIDGASPQVS